VNPERQITPSPLPAAPAVMVPAIVELRGGRTFGARVRPVRWLGGEVLRCLVLGARPVVVYVPRESIAFVVWCTEAEARAAALRHGDPLSRARTPTAGEDESSTAPPPPETETLEAELVDEGDGGDGSAARDVVEAPRVWLAVERSSASVKELAVGEWAVEHGADLVEVRPETVVFQVGAMVEGRVRAALDARGVELAAVCSRCGWTADGAAGNAWADAGRSVCQKCHDAATAWEGLR
jgi:hypothetical protein